MIRHNDQKHRWHRFFPIVTSLVIGFLITSYVPLAAAQTAWAASDPNHRAAIIKIKADLTTQSLGAAQRQIDRALAQEVRTIIFEFSGQGSSFESFSDLARRIIRLAAKQNIRTVAYVPKQALGMTMLGVFACRDIIADEVADLGQVIAPASIQRELTKRGGQRTVNERLRRSVKTAGRNSWTSPASSVTSTRRIRPGRCSVRALSLAAMRRCC